MFIEKIKKLCLILLVVLPLLNPHFVFAKKTYADAPSALSDVVGKSGIEESDISSAAGAVVKGIIGAMGLLFFTLMVYAGMVWMLARGDDARVTKARETIIAATIGLIIIVAAYAITSLVVDRIVLKNTETGKEDTTTAEEKPNTVGGELLGCCILPVDYWSKGTAIPSLATEQNCKKEAKKILGEDANSSFGEDWEFWSKEEGIKADTCVNVAKCWVGSVSKEERYACVIETLK